MYEFKIVTEESKLRSVCSAYGDINAGIRLGKQLLKFLVTTENGVGIAAPQVGHNKRVCVINVQKPIILVNPRIISKFKKITFQEGCLSFPGQEVVTQRYANVAVKADNHPHPLFFNCDENALECVCVQHEIDHLDGILMHDRRLYLDNGKEVLIIKEI
jgi:peptide deformylase